MKGAQLRRLLVLAASWSKQCATLPAAADRRPISRPRLAVPSSGKKSAEPFGILRSGTLHVIVEKHPDVGAAPAPPTDIPGPIAKRCVGIIAMIAAARTMIANIHEVRRHISRRRCCSVIRDAERNIVPMQQLEDGRLVPTRVPELETVGPLGIEHRN